MEETDNMRRSQKNELQGDDNINNNVVDELQLIVAPEGKNEKLTSDFLDANFDGLDQNVGANEWGSNKHIALMASYNYYFL